MVRQQKQPEPKEANLTIQQMEEAIPKIDRRLADLQAFDVNSINDRGDPRIDTLEKSLDALLTSIFGVGTVEYNRYHWQVTRLDIAEMNMFHQIPIQRVREGLCQGVSQAKAHLEEIKKLFLEELSDAGHSVAQCFS